MSSFTIGFGFDVRKLVTKMFFRQLLNVVFLFLSHFIFSFKIGLYFLEKKFFFITYYYYKVISGGNAQ